MDEDNLLPFSLPAVCRKKVSVAFDGGLLSSDGGVMLLRDVERRVGLAERLAGCLTDRRDPARTDHEHGLDFGAALAERFREFRCAIAIDADQPQLVRLAGLLRD